MNTDCLKVELGDCDIFSALGPSDQDRLSVLFKHRSFNKNEVIFIKGEPGYGLYVIRNGKVKICVVDHNGSELIFTFLGKGDILGELAIFDGKPRSATAIAVTDADTLYLDRQEFMDFLNTSPQASMGIINMLCRRLRRLSAQMEELSFLDVAGRIARHILAMAKMELTASVRQERATCSITQAELAKEIVASREMVNKVLNSFVDLGLITITRKKLSILDTHELNRIASYDGEG